MLHTAILVPQHLAYAAFAAASAGGGTPPQWTECGDDPRDWIAPVDAAGGLCLWHADGSLDRMEPAGPPEHADQVIRDIGADGLSDEVISGMIVRATYASSGGRIVALVEQPGVWWVCVLRQHEDTPRIGASEHNVLALAPGLKVFRYDVAQEVLRSDEDELGASRETISAAELTSAAGIADVGGGDAVEDSDAIYD